MDLLEFVVLVVIGLFAGLVGGLLGVGGSIVMIPAMTEVLGPNQHLYQSAAMIVNFFVVVPAVYQHRRAGAIERATVLRIVPLAAVAVLLGVGISELGFFSGKGEAYLRGLFGLFLLGVAVTDLYRLWRGSGRGPSAVGKPTDPDAPEPRPRASMTWTRVAAVALPTGLVAGLLGIGGGVLAVPLQRRLLHIPIRTAIANSATIIIATSSIGAVAKNHAYMADHDYTMKSFLLAAVLIPTAIIGSLNGSRLTHRLPLKTVKAAFLILLILAAARLTYKAGRDLESAAGPQAIVNDRATLAPRSPDDAIVIPRPAGEGSTFRLRPTDTDKWAECALEGLLCGLQEAGDDSTKLGKVVRGGGVDYRRDCPANADGVPCRNGVSRRGPAGGGKRRGADS